MSDSSIPPQIIVENLRPEGILVAYPLLRAMNPFIDLRDWVRFARRVTGRKHAKHGVLLARRGMQPYPSGMVCYRTERGMSRDMILVAEHFAVLDLLFPGPIILALVNELDPVATALGCHQIRFVCHDKNHHLRQVLRELGHDIDGVLLSRPLARVTANAGFQRV